MYQIINTKVSVERPFFWGQEPILRDTLAGNVRLILTREEFVGLWESDDALTRGDGFDEVTCTTNGTHLPAKGTQPGW